MPDTFLVQIIVELYTKPYQTIKLVYKNEIKNWFIFISKFSFAVNNLGFVNELKLFQLNEQDFLFIPHSSVHHFIVHFL